MIFRIVLGVGLFGVSVCGAQPAAADVGQKTGGVSSKADDEQKPEWFSCSASEECVTVQAACGRESAVNKKFVEPYNQWLKKSEDVQCASLPRADLPRSEPVASCRNGSCALQTPGDAKAAEGTAPEELPQD